MLEEQLANIREFFDKYVEAKFLDISVNKDDRRVYDSYLMREYLKANIFAAEPPSGIRESLTLFDNWCNHKNIRHEPCRGPEYSNAVDDVRIEPKVMNEERTAMLAISEGILLREKVIDILKKVEDTDENFMSAVGSLSMLQIDASLRNRDFNEYIASNVMELEYKPINNIVDSFDYFKGEFTKLLFRKDKDICVIDEVFMITVYAFYSLRNKYVNDPTEALDFELEYKEWQEIYCKWSEKKVSFIAAKQVEKEMYEEIENDTSGNIIRVLKDNFNSTDVSKEELFAIFFYKPDERYFNLYEMITYEQNCSAWISTSEFDFNIACKVWDDLLKAFKKYLGDFLATI